MEEGLHNKLFQGLQTLLNTYLPEGALPRLSQHIQDVGGPVLAVVRQHAEPHITHACASIDLLLDGFHSWEVVLITATAGLALVVLWSFLLAATEGVREFGLLPSAFGLLRKLPFVASQLAKEKSKATGDILAARAAGADKICVLPEAGTSVTKLLTAIQERAGGDIQLEEGGCCKVSGAVYIGSSEHKKMLDQVYALYSLANPLHSDIFPSLRQMEAEVVSMTASMLGGGPNGPSPSVCGAMTSGGSESILSAMKASRDFMQATRGIRRPEMIIAKSAHAAYWKAAEYFKIKLIVVPVGPDLRLSASTVKRHMTSNTAIIVASAPGFPHGVIDNIEAIAKVARAAKVCMHVDACLGGFLLPFVRRLGYPVRPFDFSVPGVTSMSADIHKFGMAHKGTSVVLYSSPDIRKHQYTSVTDWTGGLYISPGMAGSRPGALIATAWASMVHFGAEGYTQAAKSIMAAAVCFKEGLKDIPQLQLMSEPEMSVVAFKATDPSRLNMYKLNDLMTQRGWHLNALQSPPALHFCFAASHVDVAPMLLTDLKSALAQITADPDCVKGGSAPVYGLSNVSPDRGLVAEFLIAYQDVMLMP